MATTNTAQPNKNASAIAAATAAATELTAANASATVAAVQENELPKVAATPVAPVVGVPAAAPVKPVVQAAAIVTPAKVLQDIKIAQVEKVTLVAEGIFNKYSAAIAKMTTASQMRFTRLAAYIDAMKPGKPLTDAAGASYQRMMLDVVTGIINSENDFNTAFGILVQIVKQNRAGCFADTHAGRFIHAFPGSTDERQAFTRLINLLAVLGGLDDVTLAVRQVNLQHATAFLITSAGRERLVAWLG